MLERWTSSGPIWTTSCFSRPLVCTRVLWVVTARYPLRKSFEFTCKYIEDFYITYLFYVTSKTAFNAITWGLCERRVLHLLRTYSLLSSPPRTHSAVWEERRCCRHSMVEVISTIGGILGLEITLIPSTWWLPFPLHLSGIASYRFVS